MAIVIEGAIDPECHFVVDFAILKRIVRSRVDLLDHRVLLPANNPKLAFRQAHDMTYVEYLGTQTYQFPTRDCAILPIPNTTAEMLAEWFATQVRDELAAAGGKIALLEIEVEESAGQSATYSERLG